LREGVVTDATNGALTGHTQVWTVSLPVVVLNSPAVSDLALGGSNPTFGTARDVVGIVLWALGLAIETVSDAQKARCHIYFSGKVVVKTEALVLVALQVE
jgi:steroid 5-alpha reductase family enzyme